MSEHAVEGTWDPGPMLTAEDPRPGAVPRLLDELSGSLERLHAHVDTLTQRLDPVLRPSEDRGSDMLTAARERRSELSARLGSLTDRLDSANHRIAELIERLDL